MHILLSHYIYVLFSDQFTNNDPINFTHLLHLDGSWYKQYTKIYNKANYIFTRHKSVALLEITVPEEYINNLFIRKTFLYVQKVSVQ